MSAHFTLPKDLGAAMEANNRHLLKLGREIYASSYDFDDMGQSWIDELCAESVTPKRLARDMSLSLGEVHAFIVFAWRKGLIMADDHKRSEKWNATLGAIIAARALRLGPVPRFTLTRDMIAAQSFYDTTPLTEGRSADIRFDRRGLELIEHLLDHPIRPEQIATDLDWPPSRVTAFVLIARSVGMLPGPDSDLTDDKARRNVRALRIAIGAEHEGQKEGAKAPAFKDIVTDIGRVLQAPRSKLCHPHPIMSRDNARYLILAVPWRVRERAGGPFTSDEARMIERELGRNVECRDAIILPSPIHPRSAVEHSLDSMRRTFDRMLFSMAVAFGEGAQVGKAGRHPHAPLKIREFQRGEWDDHLVQSIAAKFHASDYQFTPGRAFKAGDDGVIDWRIVLTTPIGDIRIEAYHGTYVRIEGEGLRGDDGREFERDEYIVSDVLHEVVAR